MADILENPVDLIDDAYEQEIQVEQEMIEVVAYRSYNQLDDKPQINGVELVGNKTSSDLGITAQIESAINSEAQARAQADNTLQGKIDTEKLARQQADSTLQGNIDAEETARKAADKDIQDVLDGETLARQNADTALGGRIDTEIHDRQVADIGLQGQIDAITSKSDVVDVVANYAALQAYDTSTLGNNDVVKVLDDETHEDALTYYRWSTTTQTWSYIGQEAPYYSKGQMDVKLAEKQDKLTAGANIQIQNGTISATDTTYTAGNGLNLNGTEFSADTDVLATKEDLEGYYTKPEADNLLAPKLEAEVVTELPTTGEEGKLYLTPKAHTTQTASGNPISVNITDNAGKIESFQLDGDTFQQTYTGKNLLGLKKPSSNTFGFEPVVAEESGTITVNGTFTGGGGGFPWISDRQLSIPAGTYTFSMKNPQSFNVSLRMFDARGQYTSGKYIAAGATSGTFTLEYDCVRVAILIGTFSAGKTLNNQKFEELQLEAGSTATSFEPYVGGQPSPSPDYPQPIQTVTGLQTISINGTDYPLDLGTIELCKIDGYGGSTYRDSIYKNLTDNKWYLHKEVGKYVFNGSEAWAQSSRTTTDMYVGALNIISLGITANESRNKSLANRAIIATTSVVGSFSIFNVSSGVSQYMCYAVSSSYASSLAQFKEKLATDNFIVYASLATPTDTTITDTNLIAQLEAIRTASLQNGANTITNSAKAPNLAGDMEIGYHGFNPTNRYDKWLWLDLNNNYEQIGGE